MLKINSFIESMTLIVTYMLIITSCTRVKRGYGPRKVPLAPSRILEILDKHNELRASVSSSNMRFMTWDIELAKISEDYGTKCQFSHNTKGDHSKFKYSIGENIYVSRSPVDGFRASNAIQMWFDEKKDFTYSSLTCKDGKKCGHYTQVAWADTYKIGCSLTMCDYVSDFEQPNAHLFICNYSPAGNVYQLREGNIKVMHTPFIKGAACSRCSNSSDTCTENLCANAERDKSARGPLKPNFPPLSPGGGGGGDDDEINVYETSTGKSLLAGVILLSLILFALLVYTIYRERKLAKLKVPYWKRGEQIGHARFSNQNTPVPSRSTTPRHSIVGNQQNLHGNNMQGNLHGSGRLNIPPPVVPMKPIKPNKPANKDIHRLCVKSSHSAPTTPLRPQRPPPPPTNA